MNAIKSITDFALQVNEYITSGYKLRSRYDYFSCGYPCEVLQKCGLDPAYEIIITQKTAKKILGQQRGKQDAAHDLTPVEFALIPELIKTPVLVMQGNTSDSRLVFIEIARSMRKMFAVIDLNYAAEFKDGFRYYNLVASVYSKKLFQVEDLINKAIACNSIFYVDTTKIKSWLIAGGLLHLQPTIIANSQYTDKDIVSFSNRQEKSDFFSKNLSGNYTKNRPFKFKDKGDGFSYFDEDADVVDKFYTEIKVEKVNTVVGLSQLFFDEDGRLCFASRYKEYLVDLYFYVDHYDFLKEQIRSKQNVRMFLLNDYDTYDFNFLNKELATLLLEWAEAVETHIINPQIKEKPELRNGQDYIKFCKNKALFQKRIMELDNPTLKKTRKNTLSKIQPETLLPSYDDLRPVMNCILHEGGYNVCSDGHFLLKQKAEYSSDAEGKIEIPKRFYKQFGVSQGPQYYEGTYPNYKVVINAAVKGNTNVVKLDIQNLYEYMCGLSDFYKKQTDGNSLGERHGISFFTGGKHIFSLRADFLTKWIRAAYTIGANSICYCDNSHAIFAERLGDNGKGSMLVMMPYVRGDTDIDDNGKVLIDADYDLRYRAYDFGKPISVTTSAPVPSNAAALVKAKLALVKVNLKLQLQLSR